MKGIAISVFVFCMFLIRVFQLSFLEQKIESFWLQLITIDTFGQLFFFLFFATLFGVWILSFYADWYNERRENLMNRKEKEIEKSQTDEW